MVIRTFTNKYIDLKNIKVEDICIQDIAWSLSHQNRFAGHLKDNYTVADHCIYMAKFFMRKGQYKNALHALLHDSTECYITDIPSPVKTLIPEIRIFEGKLYQIIAKKFGLDAKLPEVVEQLDKAMIKKEIKQFFDQKNHTIPIYKDEGFYIFLDLFHQLNEKLLKK